MTGILYMIKIIM